MAEAILFNLAEKLLYKLGSAAFQEAASHWGIRSQMEQLKNTIIMIKGVLLDAELRQLESLVVRGWLERLQDVVYEADDLLDEFSTIAAAKLAREVCISFNCSNQIVFASSFSRRIKSIRSSLDCIAKDGDQFGFRLIQTSTRVRDQTYSYIVAEEVIGREDDTKAIVDSLICLGVEQIVSVIPIVGIGGLGKTTVAQLVYNDERVERYFDLRLWVCVSDVFDIRSIVQKIVMKPENMEMDQLLMQLRKMLDGKRFLLVLDDVWNEDREEWLKLRSFLVGSSIGSKILVTTRSREVARIMATHSPYAYELRSLSDEESWKLFKRLAFETGQAITDPELVEIGKQVVRKCSNLPLAIRALGGFLYRRDKKKWLYVRDNDLVKVTETGNNIMSILKLSYDHLSAPLKHCFAFCALFPKDYELDKEMIISLWMAEGFLVPSYEGQLLEGVGEDYFTLLVQRCFFHDLKRDENGNAKSFRLHDLMHDLAQKEAGEKSVMLKSTTTSLNTKTHHLSLGFNLASSWEVPDSLLQVKMLRTFLLPQQSKLGTRVRRSVSDSLVSSFRCLRVLDMHGLGIVKLADSVGDLIHLRYLDLSFNSHIKSLPNSISKLRNLQTLKLSKCHRLTKLPKDTKQLINLRVLENDGCDSLTRFPTGLGRLTSLRKLSLFVAGKHRHGIDFRECAQLSDLSSLNKLEGDLELVFVGDHWKNALSKANEANLRRKMHLGKLVMDFFWANYAFHEELLEGLQPHPNLKVLQVAYYMGQKLPCWLNQLSSSLPGLVEIYITNCNKCAYLPPFSRLPLLRSLNITYAHGVEYMEESMIDQSSSAATFFPSLEELMLDRMGSLRGWWREPVDEMGLPWFPKLRNLRLQNCPKLKSMPNFPHVEILKLVNVDSSLSLMKAVRTSNSRLKGLEIDNVDHLISLPKEYLLNLSSLGLIQCSDLVKLSSFGEMFQSLSSLRSLAFFHCDQLQSLSGGLKHLTAIEELRISKCNKLRIPDDEDDEQNGVAWEALKSLRSLTIRYVPNFEAFPEGWKHLGALQYLEITGGRNCSLKFLPDCISNLTTLRQIHIRECYELASLPQGICKLVMLKELEITACPKLARRCRGPRGEDWSKIKHIPNIVVRESIFDNA